MEMDEYPKSTRRNRVFILGAGFSAGADIPMTGTLLAKAMILCRAEASGLCERIDNYARMAGGLGDEAEVDYTAVDFAELCTFLEFNELREYAGGERWSDAGSREKLALRFYLAKTIARLTPRPADIPPLYLRFAEQLHRGDHVITFNWDTLLEIALLRVGKDFTYNGDTSGAIRLSKLHGSINWRLGEPSDYFSRPVNTLGWEPLGYLNPPLVPIEIYQTRRLLDSRVWDSYGWSRETEPFLVLPGQGKAYDVRSNAWNWYKPENFFCYTHDIYIIGLSLAPDDFFIKSFFLYNLPQVHSYTGLLDRRIYIINPAKEVAQNYEFILSDDRVCWLPENFSTDHVDSMRRCLD